MYGNVSCPDLQKKPCTKPNRKAAILNKKCIVLVIFDHLQVLYFKKLLLHFEDCEILLNIIAVLTQQISILRNEKGSCCNLNVHCPICPKFVMRDDSPGLKIATLVLHLGVVNWLNNAPIKLQRSSPVSLRLGMSRSQISDQRRKQLSADI